MTSVAVNELLLTLSWKCPAAGGLFSQFASFWEGQGEGQVESLSRWHCCRWQCFPDSWFRQCGGFDRSWHSGRHRVCAVLGYWELEMWETWVLGLKKKRAKIKLKMFYMHNSSLSYPIIYSTPDQWGSLGDQVQHFDLVVVGIGNVKYLPVTTDADSSRFIEAGFAQFWSQGISSLSCSC